MANNDDLRISCGTLDDLPDAKRLDDLAFGPHHGITTDELQQVINYGRLILLRTLDGDLLGESQLITEQAPFLKYQLLPTEAFLYGTAIRPDMQGVGLGHVACKEQFAIARAAGKDVIALTVRPENVASVRLHFKQGFLITGSDSSYYGPADEGGSRIIMKCNVSAERVSGDAWREVFENLHPPVFDGNNLNEPYLLVPVKFGDDIDHDANVRLQVVVDAGYHGVWLFRDSELQQGASADSGHFLFCK